MGVGWVTKLSNLFIRRRWDWHPDGENLRMRRWNDREWEYREMTPEELKEAEWWTAIR